MADFAELRFDGDGLVPVVIQDAESDAVLMMAFMNREALEATRATGRTHFWSRSRQRLWRKGEQSGHGQVVQEIFVNCELNSLLITVHQSGAVCHDGFPTCYYRRVEPDGQLTRVRDRWFDPVAVYGPEPVVRTWFGALIYLKDHDLTIDSATSRLLRGAGPLDHRIAAELLELAGVLDGSHQHGEFEHDVLLEGSQVLYWLACEGIRGGDTWDEIRPDRALDGAVAAMARETVAAMLRNAAAGWGRLAHGDRAATIHATMALVAQAIASAGLAPVAAIEQDLEEMRAKPYLASYFASIG